MRRAKKNSGASLDSLLDTMTNVVGILVILLAVTQLGVGEAVERISASRTVDPAELERARAELLELEVIQHELLARLKALDNTDVTELAEQLKRTNREVDDAEANVAALTDVREGRRRQREDELKALAQRAREVLDEQEQAERKLREEVNASADALAELRARLEDTPIVGPPPPKVIHLPNPRSAPEGTEPIHFICRGGRILHLDERGIQDRAQKFAAFVIESRKLNSQPSKGIDGDLLAEQFNRSNQIRLPDFDLELEVKGPWPRLVLNRKTNAGETTEQLKISASRYQSQLRRIRPTSFYLRFIVWPDSFETYLEARKLATQRGLLAGWVTASTSAEHRIPLGGGTKFRCGPPPKPAPKPPPRPPEDPPPKPAKPPKPPPVDTID